MRQTLPFFIQITFEEKEFYPKIFWLLLKLIQVLIARKTFFKSKFFWLAQLIYESEFTFFTNMCYLQQNSIPWLFVLTQVDLPYKVNCLFIPFIKWQLVQM